jgi:hypothetical protein
VKNYSDSLLIYLFFVISENKYVKRPKIGNIYKFNLNFVESIKIKRLKKIKTLPVNQGLDVTLVSATFSKLLLQTGASPLIIENCNNQQCRENWTKLFTHFMDDEQLYLLFNPFAQQDQEEDISNALSRWFFNYDE